MKLVYFSYFISSAYVAAHSLFRGSVARKQVELNRNHTMHDKEGIISLHKKSPEKRLFSPTEAVVDTLIWQGLASVIIPGLVINRTCALTRLLLYQLFRNKLSKTVRKWTVTGIGLGCIPFIIHPIDRYSCMCVKIKVFSITFLLFYLQDCRQLYELLHETTHASKSLNSDAVLLI